MSTAAYLGIDIGTSGIRGCCIDDAAKSLVDQQIPFPPGSVTSDGRSEQDPNSWLRSLDDLISGVSSSLQKLDNAHRIKAIAIDGTSSTLIACKRDGTVLSPALMYNDTQSKKQADIISRFAPHDSAVHGASSSLAKALLLLEKYPDTEIFCHQASWLSGKLNGQFDISDENNCLKLGYDSRTQCWPQWLQNNPEDAVIAAELLPQVVPAGTCLGAIKPEMIERYQLDEGCRIVAGTTDSNAAVLATGANQPGDAVTSLGSTLVIKLFSDSPVFSPEYGIYSHRLNGHWLVGGASNSGGSVLLQHFSQARLEEMTAQLDPDLETGLDYYPLPATGERFPVNDSNKQSRISPRPGSDIDFFQGLLEGIASIEAEGYQKLKALGAPYPRRIFTAGGGSKNSKWQKIRERLIGVTVLSAVHSDASYGSALLARQGYQNRDQEIIRS